MRIHRIDPETVTITGLNPSYCSLLHEIVPSAQVEGSPAARERLFSSPTAGRDQGLERDWENYVLPDLADHFRGVQNVVAKDLSALHIDAHDETGTVHIHVKHLDDWIHCLNQARLALAARYDFSEPDMDGPLPDVHDDRSAALFKVHFYGFLQECFLRELD